MKKIKFKLPLDINNYYDESELNYYGKPTFDVKTWKRHSRITFSAIVILAILVLGGVIGILSLIANAHWSSIDRQFEQVQILVDEGDLLGALAIAPRPSTGEQRVKLALIRHQIRVLDGECLNGEHCPCLQMELNLIR